MLCSIVVTIFNEIQTVGEFVSRVEKTFNNSDYNYELIFVDDASDDGTTEKIKELIEENSKIRLLVMSRRFGRNACFLAGFKIVKGNFAATLDCDLQDPPELITQMLDRLRDKKVHIINGVMVRRRGECLTRRVLYSVGYYILGKAFTFSFPSQSGYLKVFNSDIINEIKRIDDTESYFKGIFYWLGFKKDFFEFERDERYSGKTKYSFLSIRPYIEFLGCIFSFSKLPILAFSFFSVILVFVSLILFSLKTISVDTFLVLFSISVLALNINALAIYILQIHSNTIKRPQYIIDKVYGLKN